MARPAQSANLTTRRSPPVPDKKFSEVRYAQCWEDTDVMLSGLDVQPQHTCLSITSGGDNTLALLSHQPKKVIALDWSLAQIACLELRTAAYRNLSHPEMLTLITSKPGIESGLRRNLYHRCRPDLSPAIQKFWGDRLILLDNGLMATGKFERYLTLFRQRILPLIHNQKTIQDLFQQGDHHQQATWFEKRWNNWRWQLIFRVFFSRFVMGRLGRDPSFFKYVEEDVAGSILSRTNVTLKHKNPTENPYLQWISLGDYTMELPYALRPENFVVIRDNLNKLEIHHSNLGDFLRNNPHLTIDRFNLSNIFEWMSPDDYHRLLEQILQGSHSGSRLMYWNLLVTRQRPHNLAEQLTPLADLAEQLYTKNKIFFYKNLIIEKVN